MTGGALLSRSLTMGKGLDRTGARRRRRRPRRGAMRRAGRSSGPRDSCARCGSSRRRRGLAGRRRRRRRPCASDRSCTRGRHPRPCLPRDRSATSIQSQSAICNLPVAIFPTPQSITASGSRFVRGHFQVGHRLRDEQAPGVSGDEPRPLRGSRDARAVGGDAGVRVHLAVELRDQHERQARRAATSRTRTAPRSAAARRTDPRPPACRRGSRRPTCVGCGV